MKGNLMLDNRPYTFDRVFRLLVGVGVLWGLVWLLGYLSDALIPFAIALLLAYLINPLVDWMQKFVRNRLAAVLLSILSLTVVGLLLFFIVTPLMVGEIRHMGQLLTKMVNDAELAKRAANLLPEDLWKTLKSYAARPDIQAIFKTQNFWSILETGVRKLLPGVWGIITGTASFLIGLIGLGVIALYLVFLLMDYRKVSQGWVELVPPGYRDPVVAFIREFEAAMSQYFRGQSLVAFLCGVLFAIGFSIIGLPLGILLGLFVGLLNMVPYLQVIGFIPALFLAIVHALESGMGIWTAVGLTFLVFALVQAIQDAILVPRIMGKVTGLNPAMIMLSLSVWGKLLGLLGLIIALPLTYLMLIYYRRYLAAMQRSNQGKNREECNDNSG